MLLLFSAGRATVLCLSIRKSIRKISKLEVFYKEGYHYNDLIAWLLQHHPKDQWFFDLQSTCQVSEKIKFWECWTRYFEFKVSVIASSFCSKLSDGETWFIFLAFIFFQSWVSKIILIHSSCQNQSFKAIGGSLRMLMRSFRTLE